MSAIRFIVAAALAVLMAGGYLASQWAFFFGDPTAYSDALDGSGIAYFALALLIAAVGLGFVPVKGEGV
jgi:hypothetical protein